MQSECRRMTAAFFFSPAKIKSDERMSETMKHEKTVRLVTSAMMIALATVLSMITIVKMPLGGSLTPLSMLPICIVSLRYGVKWGVFTSFVYALVQLAIDLSSVLSWGLTPLAVAACILIDYLLAFTVLGTAGMFRNKGVIGAVGGIAVAILLRYLCHIISGGTVFSIWCEWDSAWWYSVCYNGAFMLPECVLTVIVSFILLRVPQTKKLLTGAEQSAA